MDFIFSWKLLRSKSTNVLVCCVNKKEDNGVIVTDQSSESVNIEMIEMSTNIDKSGQSSKKHLTNKRENN
jgi:hypothetical protein